METFITKIGKKTIESTRFIIYFIKYTYLSITHTLSFKFLNNILLIRTFNYIYKSYISTIFSTIIVGILLGGSLLLLFSKLLIGYSPEATTNISIYMLIREISIDSAIILVVNKLSIPFLAELSNMNLKGEFTSLKYLNINIYSYNYIPLVIGCFISIALNAILATVAGLAGMYLVSKYIYGFSINTLSEIFYIALTPTTIIILILKIILFAIISSIVPITYIEMFKQHESALEQTLSHSITSITILTIVVIYLGELL